MLFTMPGDNLLGVPVWLTEWEKSQAELGNSSEDDLSSEFERDHKVPG